MSSADRNRWLLAGAAAALTLAAWTTLPALAADEPQAPAPAAATASDDAPAPAASGCPCCRGRAAEGKTAGSPRHADGGKMDCPRGEGGKTDCPRGEGAKSADGPRHGSASDCPRHGAKGDAGSGTGRGMHHQHPAAQGAQAEGGGGCCCCAMHGGHGDCPRAKDSDGAETPPSPAPPPAQD